MTFNQRIRSPIHDKWHEAPVPAAYAWIMIAYLFLEYARPAPLMSFKLQFIVILVFALAAIINWRVFTEKTLFLQLIFLLIVGKSLFYATNTFHAYVIFKGMFGNVVICFGLVYLVSQERYWRLVLNAWIFILLYAAAYGLLHQGVGPGGFVGDENDLALAVVIGLAFALFGAKETTSGQKLVWIASSCIFFGCLVLTSSRGGFLGVLAVLIIFWLSVQGTTRKIILPILAVLSFFLFAPPEYQQEMLTIKQDASNREDQWSTGTERLFLWTTGLNMFKDKPILGVGSENFPWNVGKYQPTKGPWPEAYFRRDRTMSAAHSAYVQLLAEQGIPGVIVFILLISQCVKKIKAMQTQVERWGFAQKRKIQFYIFGLKGGLIGCLVSSIFLSSLYYPHIWYLSALISGLAIRVEGMSDKN